MQFFSSTCKLVSLVYNICMENLKDTVVAISTGSTSGAISIVRLSGEKSLEIANKIFMSIKNTRPSNFESRYLELGTISTKNFKEQAMCVVFRAPKSYTGETIVEFQCHGGLKIAQGIVEECMRLGARLATNGEFTKRAFINGKMSLASAEGVMDMINAESDSQIRAGYELLSGSLSQKIYEYQDELVDILSEIEVSFDYPEEDIEYITKTGVSKRLKVLSINLDELIKSFGAGKILSSGINVLIVGKPNVGKSSLLNALLKKERAIVTSVAGTTRDTVEDSFAINGVKINIIDTAGIHETQDFVEKIGVQKSKDLINRADIVLFVLDLSRPQSIEDQQIFDLIKNKTYIKVANKADIANVENIDDKTVVVSSVTESGIEELKQKIYSIVASPLTNESGLIITNARHQQALKNAKESIDKALVGLDGTLDLVSIDLKLAYSALGEITGNTTGEDILDSIFSKFCLGK